MSHAWTARHIYHISSGWKAFCRTAKPAPNAAYQDTIQITMGSHHYRRRPWSNRMFAELDLSRSMAIYKERFADASDFTFIFVGNFNVDSIRVPVTTYLANLPSIKRQESWKDVGIETPEGIIEKQVRKGLEPKSKVQIHFSGRFNWTPQNDYDLDAMTDVLRIKLREVLREEMGGTYGVSVSAFGSRVPREDYRVIVSFGCDPDRVEELTQAVWLQIDSLKAEPVDDLYLTKVKEIQRRAREKDLKENNFWLNKLENVYFYDEDPHTIFEFDQRVQNLSATDIQEAAQTYLKKDDVVTFVLYPENQTRSEK